MARLRIGIVGAGTIAHNVHLPVLLSMPQAEVVWLTDVNETRGRLIANAHGVPFAAAPEPDDLPGCDVALLAIPLAPREAYLEVFARRGCAVMVEKPFALNHAEHLRIQAMFPAHALGCGFQRRTYAANRFMRRAIAQQWFGPLRGIALAEGDRMRATGGASSFQDLPVTEGGGILLNLGCHALDTAFYLTGANAARCLATEVVWDGMTDRKAAARIVLSASARTGATEYDFRFCASWLDGQANEIVLTFDAMQLIATTAPASEVRLAEKHTGRVVAALQPSVGEGAVTSNQAFFLEWRSFLRGVKAGVPSTFSATSAEPTTRLVDALLSDALQARAAQ